MSDNEPNIDPLSLTTDIVASHIANNSVHSGELPALIKGVYDALSGLGATPVLDDAPSKPQGAVTARKSLSNQDHTISMIDGKPYKTLRRHITRHGHTPESYRETYGLAKDYPMVAPAYAEMRRNIAQKIGLGQKRSAAASLEPKAPARRGRKPKAAPAADEA